jgi:mannose-6-phosphate isomerase-like protein (cupin superfamily)
VTTASAAIRGHRLELAADPRAHAFARDGFLGPIRLFTAAECRRIAGYLHRDAYPAAASWYKGRGVHERFLYDLATRPAIVSLLTRVLGDDVVLWGVQALVRGPGAVHPWHSDIESCAPGERFATLWVGIEHTSRESALQLISRSHRLGRTVQEARLERGIRREAATQDAMLAIAHELDAEAALVQPDMTNGDALLFDGRLWHGSDNTRKRGRRLALLIQYAAAKSPVRIPDPAQLDWPFRFRTEPRPPAILIAGSDDGAVNRLVPAPPPISQGAPMVATAIHQFELPLEHPPEPWVPYPAFRGPTRTFADMGCHASVLAAGHSPHPPHAHIEEELLIPLRGEAEITIAASPDDPSPRVERLRPGSFVYYPAWQHHTLRNPGTAPIAYLMFKWAAAPHGAGAPIPTGIFHFGDATPPAGADPVWSRRVFEGATAYLGTLHSHLTELAPGGGYEPHTDAYDVAIVTLEGTVETLGRRVEPMSVIYYGAGEPHGMRNAGIAPARYLVFEFHAPGVDVLPPPPPRLRTLARRAIRLARRVARPVWHLIKPYLRHSSLRRGNP